MLKDHSDPAADLAQRLFLRRAGSGIQTDVPDADFSAVERLQPVDRAEERALAPPGGSEQHADLARRHVQRDPAEHVVRAKSLVDLPQLDHRVLSRAK